MKEQLRTLSAARAAQRRILVVDDEPDVADSLVVLLEAFGYEARSVRDGQAALAALADFHPDTVFVDLGLPDMDGRALGRRLRQCNGQLRLVALTGAAEGLGEAAGKFDAFILKPGTVQNIERVLSLTS